MQRLPSIKLKNIVWVVGGLIVAFIAVLAGRLWWAKNVVDDIRSALPNSDEIGLGPAGETDELGRQLRKYVDVEQWLHRATFDIAFRRCEEFFAFGCGAFDGALLAAALQRLPALESVEISAGSFPPEEREWQILFEGMARLPQLRELTLNDFVATDRSLEPLIGSQSLRRLELEVFDETEAGIGTLSQLALDELVIWAISTNQTASLAELLEQIETEVPYDVISSEEDQRRRSGR